MAALAQKKKQRVRAQKRWRNEERLRQESAAAARAESEAAARAEAAAFELAARDRRLEIDTAFAAGARPCPNCNGYIRPDTLICADTPWRDLRWRKDAIEAGHPSFADLRRERQRKYRKAGTGHCEHPDCPTRTEPLLNWATNAHHLSYQAPPGAEPDSHLILLCEHCHVGEDRRGGVHGLIDALKRDFPVGPIRASAARARGVSEADRALYGDPTEWRAPV